MPYRPVDRRSVAAAVIGNALEWYDFTVYGYLAVTIARRFFPIHDGWAGLTSTLAIFGVPFFIRPIAGIALGYWADAVGRKPVLTTTIALMTAGGAIIALAPTYDAIGTAAAFILLIGRLIQGVSVGGEFAVATALLFEIAPASKRGFYASWQFAGQGAAVLLAGLAGTAVARTLSPQQFESWGWRIPFLVGLVIGPIGLYMRATLFESADFLAARASKAAPPSMRAHLPSRPRLGRLVIGFGLIVGATASVYVLFVFMPTYAVKELGLDIKSALIAPVIGGATVTILCPIAGFASDRIGRKLLLLFADALLLVVLYPAFRWLQASPTLTTLALVQCAFGVLVAAYAGPLAAVLAELFPIESRSASLSAAYNLAVALFGGMAPLVVSWLLAKTGNAFAPVFYVAIGLMVSLLAVTALPQRGIGRPPLA